MAPGYLEFSPCCKLPGYAGLSFAFDPLIVPGTYTYTGPAFTDGDNLIIEGTCYMVSVKLMPPLGLVTAPDISTLTLIPGGCADLANCGCIVLPCNCSRATNPATVPTSLRYIDCNGDIQYTEPLAYLETSLKYCVSEWITGVNVETFGTCLGNECPTPTCYTLYSCDGSELPFNTLTDLSAYSDTGVSITLTEYPDVCFLVYENASSDCLDPQVVTFNAMGVDCCESTCYYVNTGSITYVDEDGLIVDAIGPLKFCSNIYPVVDALNGSIVTSFGLCIDNLCPPACYVLTDCDGLADPIYTTSESVLPFLGTGAAFHINGYTNCWTVDTSMEDCACAISIVITTTYADCETCAGYTSYKLTDCANSANIIYTSTDLSLYVNQVIEQDCPGCWFVEEFFLQPPSNTAITVTNSFVNCTTCEQTYYLLTDCAEVEPNIITTTDLSANVGGVITLDWCPETCWQVTETREHNSSTIVFVKDQYETCEDCLTVDVCECTIFICSNKAGCLLEYVDCENISQSVSLIENEVTDKLCVKSFTPYLNLSNTTYGDCINNECTSIPFPIRERSVRPGYNTPTCTTDHYEKIACSFADAMYSNTLEKRYGITSCCPEDREKWELKYEIIEFAALVDPNYICTTSSTCCDSVPTQRSNTCVPLPIPPVVCHLYTITIGTYEGTSISFLNCLGQVQIALVPASKSPVEILVCGIAGQTIVEPLDSFEFSVIETDTTCT